MERAVQWLGLKVRLEVQRLPEIDESLASVFREHQDLSHHARIVPVPKEDIRERFVVLLYGGLIENELRNDEDGTIQVFLGFEEKLEMVFFSVNEPVDKAFGVDEKDEGGRAVLYGFAVEAGLVRTGPLARSVEERELREKDLEKPSDGQKQRHVEIEGDFGVRKVSSSEIVVVKKIIQVAPVLGRVYHRAFLLKALQTLLCVLVDFGSPEKGIKHPAQ